MSTLSAALPGAALRMTRTAIGRRALQVGLLVCGFGGAVQPVVDTVVGYAQPVAQSVGGSATTLAYGVAGDVRPFAYSLAGEVSPFAGGAAGQAAPLARDVARTTETAGGPLVHNAATGVQGTAEAITPGYLPGAAHNTAYGI